MSPAANISTSVMAILHPLSCPFRVYGLPQQTRPDPVDTSYLGQANSGNQLELDPVEFSYLGQAITISSSPDEEFASAEPTRTLLAAVTSRLSGPSTACPRRSVTPLPRSYHPSVRVRNPRTLHDQAAGGQRTDDGIPFPAPYAARSGLRRRHSAHPNSSARSFGSHEGHAIGTLLIDRTALSQTFELGQLRRSSSEVKVRRAASTISSVHPPFSFSPSLVGTATLSTPLTSVHASGLSSPLSHTTASALSTVARTLCAWRFQTFYKDFLPQKSPAASRSILHSVSNTVAELDWFDLAESLEAAYLTHDRMVDQGTGFKPLTTFRLKNERVYKAVNKAAKNTAIPARQIRRAVEAYAHYNRRCDGIRSWDWTAKGLAEKKDWETLARIVLEDIQGLNQKRGNISVIDPDQDREVLYAVRKCREHYFSDLECVRTRLCGFKVRKTVKVHWTLSTAAIRGLNGDAGVDEEIVAANRARRLGQIPHLDNNLGWSNTQLSSSVREKTAREGGFRRGFEEQVWERQASIETPVARRRFPIDGSPSGRFPIDDGS